MPRRFKLGIAAATPGVLVVLALTLLAVPSAGCTPAALQHRGAPPPPGFFGVNAANLEPQDTALMQAGGVGVVRSLFLLSAVRDRPGAPYAWDSFDGLVGDTAQRGLDLIPVLYGVPPWISTERSAIPIGNRESASEWRQFLEAVVARYGPLGDFWRSNPYVAYRPIEAWQVWNEPNSKTWWGPRPRPREYGVLMQRSANAIHRVDPGARGHDRRDRRPPNQQLRDPREQVRQAALLGARGDRQPPTSSPSIHTRRRPAPRSDS